MHSVSTSGGECADHGTGDGFASSRRAHALSPPLPEHLALRMVLEQRCQLLRQLGCVRANLNGTAKETALPLSKAKSELGPRTWK